MMYEDKASNGVYGTLYLTADNVSLTPLSITRAAVCCNVLQYVAVCCSVLQCVAVCCSVLQCQSHASLTYSIIESDTPSHHGFFVFFLVKGTSKK